MQKSLFFSKYHGNGNDFILIDDRKKKFPDDTKLIKKICHRNLGIGADGLILLCNSKVADFKMRIFNKDGSEAKSCGNGLICLLIFLLELGLEKKGYSIETLSSIVEGSYLDDKINILMHSPKILRKKLLLHFPNNQNSYEVIYIDSGVFHIVYFVKDINNVDIEKTGKDLRYHSYFSPHGVNVNFAEKSKNFIKARTYEKGVEKETLSCGTGSVAIAIAAHITYGLKSPITVKYKLGDINISFNNSLNKVNLQSFANYVYSGKYIVS